jgi:hypothetical protein
MEMAITNIPNLKTITAPSSMYKSLLTKGLIHAIRSNCLQEFITMNDVSSIINTSPGKLSFIGTVVMQGNDNDVLLLIQHGLIPNQTSKIIVDDNNEFGLRKYYDETYNMEDQYKHVPDLIMIAHECSYELYTKVIDTVFTDASRWSVDNLQGLISEFFTFLDNSENNSEDNYESIEEDPIPNESNDEIDIIQNIILEEPKKDALDTCFRYLLNALVKLELLNKVINSNFILRDAYDLYEKSHNPINFKILFEYGIDPNLYIREWKDVKLSWLIEHDPVIRDLYQPISSTKRAN